MLTKKIKIRALQKSVLMAAFIGAFVGALGLTTTATHAQETLSGQIFENVPFDCTGVMTHVVRPNSNRPAMLGNATIVFDLPEAAGGSSWSMPGVVKWGANRAINTTPKEVRAPIVRCFGLATVRFSDCDSFSGVRTCNVEFRSRQFKVTVDRGNKGLMSSDAGTHELMSTDAATTELMSSEAGTTE